MSAPQPDLPASLREAIEREAEREASSAHGRWHNPATCPTTRQLIAYGERIARLTLEAERQRQEQP